MANLPFMANEFGKCNTDDSETDSDHRKENGKEESNAKATSSGDKQSSCHIKRLNQMKTTKSIACKMKKKQVVRTTRTPLLSPHTGTDLRHSNQTTAYHVTLSVKAVERKSAKIRSLHNRPLLAVVIRRHQ